MACNSSSRKHFMVADTRVEQVRQQGALAADVLKQLKAGLAVVRQGLARAQEDAAGVRRSLAELDGASQAVLAAAARRSSAATSLETARQRLAKVNAQHAGAAETEARRRALAEEVKRAKDEHDACAQRLSQELPRLQQREASLQQRTASPWASTRPASWCRTPNATASRCGAWT